MNQLKDKSYLVKIFSEIEKIKIGVIGDFTLDAYWLLDDRISELSVETGKPTRAVVKQRYSLGGAGNVISNLVDLGVPEVFAFGIVGDDIFGREMLNQLQKRGANAEGIIIQEVDWDTPVYGKPYMGTVEQERIDFGRFNRMDPITEKSLIGVLLKVVPKLDALIVNQQLTGGIYSEGVIRTLNELAASTSKEIFVLDSRNMSEWFKGMICKINATEAARICGERKERDGFVSVDDIRKYARQIYEKNRKPVYISRGDRGIVLYSGDKYTELPGVQILGQVDPVGAGDTMVATITAVLAAGGNYEVAGEIGNLAAAVTVRKVQQTGTASPEEIVDMWENADYVYRPELGDDIRRARYIEGSEVEIVTQDFCRGSVQHVIFDHDGTISVLRQGWEAIMEPLMVRFILGGDYTTVEEETYHHVVERVREYIDQSTGIETIRQMQALVGMVREFGFVPEDQVLTAEGYKELYNEALIRHVEARLAKLRRGELEVSDFVIKGAVEFIRRLYAKGVTLYLASGTDQADVVREAESLGYAHFFQDRIYGYMGDASTNTKRRVIKTIIGENKLEGKHLVCFGDGPVELRETKRFGGIAIGVASDEIRRYGLNVSKRARLIKAGADLIIPDYSQSDKIFALLFDANQQG